MKDKDILRIIDANLNRFREALRVCEDVARFAIEDKRSTHGLKSIRHEVSKALSESKGISSESLVSSRDSENDIGRFTEKSELNRRGAVDILGANLQRAKESARVLEESLKVIDKDLALRFKKIRFKVYNTEKVLIERLRSSSNTGQKGSRR